MTERQCGGCTLCCKLLPVRSLDKKDGQRCQHQRAGKGCAVYSNLIRIAPECVFWTCRWLNNDDTADLSRPDRSGYVIDVMPDFVTAQDDDTGAINEVPVIQIWVDPKRPDAHKDPALRAWLDRNKHVAIVRYSANEAFVLFPPSRMKDGQWLEKHSNLSGPTHTAEQLFRVLSENPSP